MLHNTYPIRFVTLAFIGLIALISGSVLISSRHVEAAPGSVTGIQMPAFSNGQASPSVVPGVINYQGTLRDLEGALLNGDYDLTFKIYDSLDGTTPLWSEEHLGITVRSGYFSVLLGDNTPLTRADFANADRFIGVTIQPFDELVPRQRFSSVPYALLAEYAADAHDGVPVGGVVDWWRPAANDSEYPIPDGFQLCDGSVVTDPLSPYVGKNTPDLRGRMVRGASGDELSTGGTTSNTVNFSQIPAHSGTAQTSDAGGHSHHVSGHTESISNQGNHPGNHDYKTVDDGRGWGNYNLAINGDPSRIEGQHRHDLNIGTSSAGDHSHSVNIGTHPHSGSQWLDNNPPYMNLLKLCRIR